MQYPSPEGLKKYIFTDALAAYIGWLLFFILRKINVEHLELDLALFARDDNFLYAGILVAFYWLVIYLFTNTYQSIYAKSRLAEIFKTVIQSFFGCLFLCWMIILDDEVQSYEDYYFLIETMFLTHFIPTLLFRMMWLTKAKYELYSGKVSFSTLILGNHPDLKQLYHDLKPLKKLQGLNIEEIWTNQKIEGLDIPTRAYTKASLQEMIAADLRFKNVILALSKEEHDDILNYIRIFDEEGLHIKVIPELYDSITTNGKINNPLGAPLIDVDTDITTPWQQSFKRLFDIFVSVFALVVTAPLLAVIAILIKRSSPGPVFYQQERIGLNGKPFTIYKFRSMYLDAENNGPQLSKSGDDRTTSIGAFIRKYRIDEIPQFFNVLKGDMSLVGPRPERKFYADQIIERAPEYKYLYKMQPGITSWGMVRYGYASSVDEMLQRMKYDLMYINNYSILMDFRILIYTVLTIIKGKGV